MSTPIEIRIGNLSVAGELNDSDCAGKIADALPIETTTRTWGEEIYFDIGIDCELGDDARDEMTIGELGYWPTGSAFCIFFGRTPVSGPDGMPKAASAVNPIGHVCGDTNVFHAIRSGQDVTLQRRQ